MIIMKSFVGCVSQHTNNSNQKRNIYSIQSNGTLGNVPYKYAIFIEESKNLC